MKIAPFFFVLVVGLMVAVFVAIAVGAHRATVRRREGMAAYAAARGWTYELGRPSLMARFEGAPFGRGSSRAVSNVVEGVVEGRPFVAFDYRYETGSGDDRSTSRFSVVVLHLGVRVPELQVRPQGGFGRFFSDLFGTDHHIGDPAFDDHVHISTNSPEFAADVLHPEMRRLLLSRLHRSWRFEGDSLLTFAQGSHSPLEIDEALGSALAVVQQVPVAVWTRLGGGIQDTPDIRDTPSTPWGSPPSA